MNKTTNCLSMTQQYAQTVGQFNYGIQVLLLAGGELLWQKNS